jgi:hypothetical protein
VWSLPEVLPGGALDVAAGEVVGLPAVPPHPVRHRLVAGAYDTGMGLLIEAAEALELAAAACDAPEDAERFSALADRVRGYLAVSRSTTTLGMPRIPPGANRLTDDGVIHRSGAAGQSHIRVIPG